MGTAYWSVERRGEREGMTQKYACDRNLLILLVLKLSLSYKKKTHFHSHSLSLHHLLEILKIKLSTEVQPYYRRWCIGDRLANGLSAGQATTTFTKTHWPIMM